MFNYVIENLDYDIDNVCPETVLDELFDAMEKMGLADDTMPAILMGVPMISCNSLDTLAIVAPIFKLLTKQ